MSNNKPGAKHQEILIESAQLTSSAHGIAAVWLTASFAREWFNDAVHEASTGGDIQAKRREIVFTVSFAESYLFEWVRDQVLDTGDLEQLVIDLERYFPSGDEHRRVGVLEKWKDVPKKLKDDCRIGAAPNLSLPYWANFRKLVFMRNGLIHANASRPEDTSQPRKENPFPSGGDLGQLEPGWATRVVVELVSNLHAAVGTAKPDYLVAP